MINDTAIVNQIAHRIFDGMRQYFEEFAVITRRARVRFVSGDWSGLQADGVERLDLYGHVVQGVVSGVCEKLGERVDDKSIWPPIKIAYSELIDDLSTCRQAESFFNSISRRIFSTVGVNPDIEFVDSCFDEPSLQDDPALLRSFALTHDPAAMLRQVVGHFFGDVQFADLDCDLSLAGKELQDRLGDKWPGWTSGAVEIVDSPFFRGRRAYIVGRITVGEKVSPLVIVLVHRKQGVYFDAVLIDENEASIIFSFTRSYLHVDVAHPDALVAFLKVIMPLKPMAELYTAIGFNKHGKTELYRDVLDHLGESSEQFVHAPGDTGLVMIVFTLPSYDVVFKVIRDKPLPPKTMTRRDVREKYQLVFKHDRAGRLVDAQEFEHLEFAIERFSDDLLEELKTSASESISISSGFVDLKHVYTERRITPLNLYLREEPMDRVLAAVTDYGQAIKDLAFSNIFPGDLLLKNFGVTRHGRVIFYDYDELCLLTTCRFRKMPVARDMDEEMSAEPWFYVAENDIFPEEFPSFLCLRGEIGAHFDGVHGDLFTPEYWRQIQQRHLAEEIIEICPYGFERRLHPELVGQ